MEGGNVTALGKVDNGSDRLHRIRDCRRRRNSRQSIPQPYRSYSFHDDLEDGTEMQKAGRLSEVRKNWSRWYDTTRK